ncbi:MAG: TetR/AcrR family transcriptional regulator [Gammaproteobacteria bacterium]|nr:TetR/AcrR family transcriptional regulator [Gammaproteobacteria bacterium]
MTQAILEEQTPAIKYPLRTKKKNQTRRRIILDTAKLASMGNFDNMTMAMVADRADVHVTTLFTHFKNKRELLAALSEPAMQDLSRYVAESRGKVPFFKFYKMLWAEFLTQLNAGETGIKVLLWQDQLELVPAWLNFERHQLSLFADYLEDDYPLNKTQARLIAGMLVSANIFALDDWLANSKTSNIKAQISKNIKEVERILQKSFF